MAQVTIEVLSEQALNEWRRNQSELHPFVPEYHRLQLEHWIWRNRERLSGRVMDVGVQNPRRWIGRDYFTLGYSGDTQSDKIGDLTDLPLENEALDAIVCTEVLEHCADPFYAVTEMHRVLKPGGLLLVTSPFFWPWHGNADYPDYWRFTDQGWRYLLRDFSAITVEACAWTDEGAQFIDRVRQVEGWGSPYDVHGHTAYLCEAIK